MDAEAQAAKRAARQAIISNGAKLAGVLCVLAFVLGGPSTRGWMLGFLSGTVSGLLGASSRAGQTSSEVPPSPLRLLGHGCRQEYGFQTCEGEVRNISDERLDNVMAEVRFQDKAGNFLKSEDALIAYQPLLPGQTSPFKVATPNNPLIRHYTIGFRQMFGGELRAAR